MEKKLTLRITAAFALLFLAVNFIKAQALSASITGQTNVTCFGNCDGSLSVTATGGTSSYSYIWSQGATTQSITNLCAGTYSCTVDDGVTTVTVTATVTQPTAISVSVSPQSVCSGSAVSLCATVGGGVPAYTFIWNPAAGLSNANISCPTSSPTATTAYTLTVTDANGCVGMGTTTVTVNPLPTVAPANSGPYCAGSNIVLTANASGGMTYSWVGPNAFTSTVLNPTIISATPANSGTYTCTVTSPAGCTASGTTNVVVNSNPNVTASATSICAGGTATLTATNALTYSWAPGGFTSSTVVTSPTVTTTYTVTGTNASGCVGTATATVNVYQNPVASVVSQIEPGCGNNNGSLTGTAFGGSAPYTYQWNPGVFAPAVVTGLVTGTYTLVVTEANGCTDTLLYQLLDSCEVVWPGDADNDLVANNFDILDIGLYYGTTTNARPVQGNNWAGYPSENAALTKPNTYNVKHDDCNGDGMVDASDTTAVILNYNLLHPPYKLIMNPNATGVPLYTEFVVDTVSNSNHAVMKVKLGTTANPATNIYGVALTLTFDTTIVAKDSATMNVSSSWLAAGSPVFLNNKVENYNNGEFDIALCRTNQNHINGDGEIAELDITMKDDISGKVMSNLVKTLIVNITKVKIIDANGDTTAAVVSGDSLKVTQTTTEVVTGKDEKVAVVKVFPNPASGQATVHSTKNDISKVELFTLQGKLVCEKVFVQHVSDVNLNISECEKGIYLLKVHSAGGIKNIRLLLN